MLAGTRGGAGVAAEQAFRAAGGPRRSTPRFEIAAAKVRAGEAAGVGAGIAHQVHGAIGFTYEHSLHFATRRLWSWRAEFGTESGGRSELGRLTRAAAPTRSGRRSPRDEPQARIARAATGVTSMTYKCLLHEVKDGVATLTLNRPDRLNALGDTLRDDLHDAIVRSSADPEVRVMIVTGAGKGFCAGGDVKAMNETNEAARAGRSSTASRPAATARCSRCGTRPSRSSPRSTAPRPARA